MIELFAKRAELLLRLLRMRVLLLRLLLKRPLLMRLLMLLMMRACC